MTSGSFRDPRNRARLQRAARRAAAAELELHQLIREVADTETVRAIADATGLSVGHVHKVKTEKEA